MKIREMEVLLKNTYKKMLKRLFGIIYYLSLCNKSSFRLRLNNEIEILQLRLRERAFQILALKLLMVFEPRGTLRTWDPRVLCSWILSFLKYN